MTELLMNRPAEPAEQGDSIYGGFADIARRLNALHPERKKPISRQLVERWYKCRESNGFPEREPVEVKGGKVKPLFDLQDVERWHTTQHRPRPRRTMVPIETIPLFSVDRRGSMIA
jgi:hypothetical protein